MKEKLSDLCREQKQTITPRKTNQDVAENTDLSVGTVSQFFRGDIKNPSVYTVGPICREMGVSMDEYFGIPHDEPAESGLVSVTVVCGDGAWADALSTACFVLGEAGSLALRDTLAAEKNLRIELILVTDDGHVRYTAGLAERFEPSEEGTYVYEAIIA